MRALARPAAGGACADVSPSPCRPRRWHGFSPPRPAMTCRGATASASARPGRWRSAPMRVARRLRAMRWGFVPHWYKTPADGPRLIHARAETVADTPAFRAAAGQRRCLVAADGHCEWTREAGQVPGPGEAGIARADAAMSRSRCPGLPRPHAQERADSGRKHAKIRFPVLPPGFPERPREAGEAKKHPGGCFLTP